MRTFWVLNVALVLGCGGNDYSDYFVPTGADRNAGSTTNGSGGTSGASGSSTGGTGGASGAGGGSSGTGSTGTGGRGGSSGSGGSSNTGDAGAAGCRTAPGWMMGQLYMAGATVKAVCMSGGGGSTMCEVGKAYLWACKEGAVCGIYAPGADGWWGAWTVGTRCD